jgi:hypothetical protein
MKIPPEGSEFVGRNDIILLTHFQGHWRVFSVPILRIQFIFHIEINYRIERITLFLFIQPA